MPSWATGAPTTFDNCAQEEHGTKDRFGRRSLVVLGLNVFIVSAVAGWVPGYYVVMGISAVQVLFFLAQEKSLAAFPVQIRVVYFDWLVEGNSHAARIERSASTPEDENDQPSATQLRMTVIQNTI